jgi:tRNA-dihydrouridine synthase B
MALILNLPKPIYALAPLAGFTDLPFRGLVKRFGADLTVSEMINSNALSSASIKTEKMLQKSPLEKPYSIQLAGSEPEVIKRALDVINTLEGVDIVDLNCGCPVPKVVNNMQGSALLKDLELMGKIIETIKEYSNKKYTSVKIRLGFNDKNHINIAKVVQDAGADFIVVHGRTRADRFKAPVDYKAIAEVKRSLNIPVIANGDIDSIEKAEWVLNYTGCDGVMIGRGAIGKPWIFKQMKEGIESVNRELIASTIMEHFEEMINHYGKYGVMLFRKHLHRYSKLGYSTASTFRERINRTVDENMMRMEIERFFFNVTEI